MVGTCRRPHRRTTSADRHPPAGAGPAGDALPSIGRIQCGTRAALPVGAGLAGDALRSISRIEQPTRAALPVGAGLAGDALPLPAIDRIEWPTCAAVARKTGSYNGRIMPGPCGTMRGIAAVPA